MHKRLFVVVVVVVVVVVRISLVIEILPLLDHGEVVRLKGVRENASLKTSRDEMTACYHSPHVGIKSVILDEEGSSYIFVINLGRRKRQQGICGTKT